MGISVGTLIILTNLQTIGEKVGIDQNVQSGAFVAFGLTWIAVVGTMLVRKSQASSPRPHSWWRTFPRRVPRIRAWIWGFG